MAKASQPSSHHGPLAIPLPFEDALRAVLRVKPDDKAEQAKSRRKAPKAAPRHARRHGTAP